MEYYQDACSPFVKFFCDSNMQLTTCDLGLTQLKTELKQS